MTQQNDTFPVLVTHHSFTTSKGRFHHPRLIFQLANPWLRLNQVISRQRSIVIGYVTEHLTHDLTLFPSNRVSDWLSRSCVNVLRSH